MPNFRIEPMPSRTLKSAKVVYYVRLRENNTLVTKFDNDIQTAEEINGWDGFTSEQKLELQNYLANVHFTTGKLNLPAKLNRDYRLSLPVPLQEALFHLYEQATDHNIAFDPMSAMLNGLLNHIVTTEKRLSAMGVESVMEGYGIGVSINQPMQNEKEIRKYTKKIFKSLLSMNEVLDQYAHLAKRLYDKDTNINNATLIKYSEGKSKPSQWSISCALTLLGQNKHNLLAFLPISVLTTLWLTPLRFIGKIKTANEALKFFNEIFSLSSKEMEDALVCIKAEMERSL